MVQGIIQTPLSQDPSSSYNTYGSVPNTCHEHPAPGCQDPIPVTIYVIQCVQTRDRKNVFRFFQLLKNRHVFFFFLNNARNKPFSGLGPKCRRYKNHADKNAADKNAAAQNAAGSKMPRTKMPRPKMPQGQKSLGSKCRRYKNHAFFENIFPFNMGAKGWVWATYFF